jgi:hypothetical protein
MPTLRESALARTAALRAEADAIEAKIAAVPSSLVNVLDHDVDVVVGFFRTWGESLFGHKAAPAPATPAAPTAPADDTAAQKTDAPAA